MKFFLLFLLPILLVNPISTFGQTISVEGAVGRAIIKNITPEQAYKKAIEEAKLEALRKAGVAEYIQSFDFLEKKETQENFEEFFLSLTSVQSRGSVLEWKETQKKQWFDEEFDNFIVEVTIDAVVKKTETNIDPEFKIDINGILPAYYNNDKVKFSIFPNKSGYLKIFIMDKHENVVQLFPNSMEENRMLSEKETYDFPMNSGLEYSAVTEEEYETQILFFLFTKRDFPIWLNRDSNYDEMLKYIYSIDPSMKFLKISKVNIYSR